MSCEETMSPEEFDVWMASERERKAREAEEFRKGMDRAAQMRTGSHRPSWGVSWGSVVRYEKRSNADTDAHLRAYGIKP